MFGPLEIHSYGFFLALAFLFGLLILLREGKLAGLKQENLIDEVVLVIIFSIIGSRIMYVIQNFGEYQGEFWSILRIQEGGMSFHGGAIGGFAAVFYYGWRKKIPQWKPLDCGMPGLVLGAAVARIGCLMNGCCYGRPWNGPFAIAFQAVDNIPRFPAQLLDMSLHLIFLPILFYLKRFKKRDGDMVAFYLMGFSIIRYTSEIYRNGATGKVLAFGITVAQWASFGIFALGLFMYLFRPLPMAAVEAETAGVTGKSSETSSNTGKDKDKGKNQGTGRGKGTGKDQDKGNGKGKAKGAKKKKG